MGIDLAGLDVDVTDDLLAQAMLQYMQELGGGYWPMRVGQWPKALWLFRVSGAPIKRRQYPLKREGADRQLVEVLGVSAKNRPTQAVLFGTHPSGVEYTWNVPVRYDALPTITQEQMDGLATNLLEIGRQRGWEIGRGVQGNPSDGTGSDLGAEAFDRSLVGPVVDLIPNDDLEYDAWIATAYSVKACLGAAGWETFARWSAKAPKNQEAVTQRIWQGLTPNGTTGMGKLVFLARHACGGTLPGDLEDRVRQGALLKGAQNAGMPMASPEVQQALTPPSEPQQDREWMELVCDNNNQPIANMANVRGFLNNSDLWRDCFAYDAFADRCVIRQPLPEDKNRTVPRWMEDGDLTRTHGWFQRHMWPKIGKTDVMDAVDWACSDSKFEPVQEYLHGLKWDGVKRIDGWLSDYAGVDATMDPIRIAYIQQVGRKWLISAVARAMQPGCKADCALILEGLQGVNKSSLLAALCPDPDWFGDGLPDFHTKDASSYLQGKWIVEMAELTNLFRSQVEDMRNYLSRRVDNFRPAYGRKEVKRPRRVVFAGSTNRREYLQDAQGERRFWIVRCSGTVRVQDVIAIRDQLWAEALVAYQDGESWWLDQQTEAYARTIQQTRVPTDEWKNQLHFFLHDKTEVTISMCAFALGLSVPGKRDTKMEHQVGKALRDAGWVAAGQWTHIGYKGQTRFVPE